MPSQLDVSAASSSLPIASSSAFTLVNSDVSPGAEALNGLSVAEEMDGKDPAEQLEALNNQLILEYRIQEGAENLLSMQLADPLRLQVESELGMSKGKIDALLRQIEISSSRSKPKQSNGAGPARRRGVPGQTNIHIPRTARDNDDKGGDDFRTALHNASIHMQTLKTLAQSETMKASTSPSPSTSTSHVANSAEQDCQFIETMSKIVRILKRNLRVRYELNITDILQVAMPMLSDKRSKQCRATAYQLLRHALIDSEAVKRLGQNLDWFLVKSLNRDIKHAVEKEQAIKLIRTLVEIGTPHRDSSAGGMGSVPLSEPVMRALIAVAEHPEEPFRLICTQTLSEILLIDIDLVSRTGGIRFLLHVLGEGPLEITPLLAATFLHIVDSPRTRAYLRVGSDLELALSSVTDAYGKGPDHADRMRGCAKVIQLMLRTWSGLMYFCMDDMRAIRSLVDTLRIPSLETREIILDMFFDLLSIKSPEWYQTFIDGRRLTMYRKSSEAPEQRTEQDQGERSNQTLKLTDQYLALLVLVFTNAGLCDALTSMIEETTTGSNLSRKATLLMAEVLQMANRVLPLSVAAKIQTIPHIFEMATNYSDGEHRIVGTSALSAIDSFNRNRARLQPCTIKSNRRQRANSVEDAVRRGQRQVEQVKLKMSMQMDDKMFQSSLLETQVMLTKDYTRWNFETLQELIEGPLLNPKRMEEAIKVSRFIRRLMSFFHPFNHRFSDMPRIKSHIKWVRLGCSLMTTLISSSDGVRYLATEDKFLAQIVDSFAQLDPFNGHPDSDPVFSKKRVSDTLTYGYLEMLGTLSKYKEGIELLEKFKVFTAFYHLSELRSREDLIKGIVENLDYNIDGHPRIVLSKALTSSYKHIRVYATQHLGELIRRFASANAWTLRLLLTQLYDPAPEVCELAVHFLEEACESKDILQLVVGMQPTMDHLGEIGHPLLLKFMSTPMGFRYLYDAGYIDREMDMWFNERNIYYVVQVEVFLSKVFNNPTDEDDILAFDGTVPPHFYGEMAKTELGCQILQEKGHFAEFSQFIRQHSHESEDTELLMKLKSILWAVGNVGATEGGLPFLEEEEIIPAVLDIAEKSPVPSIRGTCFFVLGLISSTSQGAEILDDYRWEATLSPLGTPTGLCIPVDFATFTTIPSWTQKVPAKTESRLIPSTNEAEIEVITAIQNLANTVIANAASRSLAKMKSRPEYRSIFSSPTTFFRALHIISTQRYRLPVRRYIMDLFNLELNPELVATLKECSESLKAHSSYRPSASDTSRLSIFGRIGRTRAGSESDDEDDELDTTATPTVVASDQPVLTLQPVTKIIGFDI